MMMSLVVVVVAVIVMLHRPRVLSVSMVVVVVVVVVEVSPHSGGRYYDSDSFNIYGSLQQLNQNTVVSIDSNEDDDDDDDDPPSFFLDSIDRSMYVAAWMASFPTTRILVLQVPVVPVQVPKK